MQKIIISFLLLVVSFISFAQQDNYKRIRIYCNDVELKTLQNSGVTIDHGNYRKNVWFESDFSSNDLDLIKNSGLNYEVLIDDVQQFYLSRNQEIHNEERADVTRTITCNEPNIGEFTTPENFSLGSMGGFFTYDEFLAHLDTMYSKYPNLITQKDTIDTITSIEGRPIYWLKISDNPTVDENEPEILYTAVHHAREPASLSQVIMYMYYLLENYGTNDEVTYIVDNTELYFVPMVNPDGYIYNETTNPNGGGQWRKNRRNNNDGNMGVDLNRNYGHNWGYDDNGSSPSTNSDTYRGTEAFSEPETKATKWMTEHHNFITALNYHTFGNLLIYPWGYEASIYTPDSAIFVEYAKVLTEVNHYNYGTGDQTVGYVTNGDSDDWMYGEQTSKNKILSFTPEAGESGDGFWPAISRIETISKENIRQNLNLALLVNEYAKVEDLSGTTTNQQLFYLPYNIKRLGYSPTGNYTVSLIPLDTYSTIANNSKSYNSLALLQEAIDSFQVVLSSSITDGQSFQLELSVSNGTLTFRDTLTKTYGELISLFKTNGSTMNDFVTPDNWGVASSYYYSAPSSIADSPNGNYENNANTNLYLDKEIDLTLATRANVTFMTKWAIESGYDYVQLRASNDSGNSWSPLCGKHTKPGTADQDKDQPLWDGFQLNWVQEEIDLSDYLGEKLKLQFRLMSDVFVNEDGFYFDDLEVNIMGEAVKSNVEELNNYNISIYPNPNNGSFTINGVKNGDGLSIYNAIGEQITSKTITSNQIKVNNLSNGIYFIKIDNFDRHYSTVIHVKN